MKSIHNPSTSVLLSVKLLILLLFVFLPFSMKAYNLRQLSSRDGLSNSAILSLCQDSERFMWIGTVDGLNVYNGLDINIFKPNMNALSSVSGNVIEEVWEGEEGIIWINTNHGLNRYDKKTNQIESFNEFEGKYYSAKTSANEIFTISENNTIHYYDRKNSRFLPIPYPGLIKDEIQRIFIDKADILWVVTNKGIIYTAAITFQEGTPVITGCNDFPHTCKILYAFMEEDRIYFINQDYYLFEMDALSRKKSLVMNLKKEMEEKGVISSIIKDNNDYFIAFQTNGLIHLENTPENVIKYKINTIDIHCGIFCLHKDKEQNIVWIGTDGQGLYMYNRDMFSIRSVTFEQLHNSIRKPVRALLLDEHGNLWIGTKDDGILLIENYRTEGSINRREIQHLTVANSGLLNNSVYAFEKSRRNILWIGGDGPGLNYYSYKEKKIKEVPSGGDVEDILYIHTICEVNDTTLWLASVGNGIYKAIISGSPDAPFIKSVERHTFVKDEMSYNFFFTACQENDSIIWFGNRGQGFRRLNVRTETFEEVRFENNDVRTMNDILSIHKDNKNNLWVGTSFGLLKLLNYDETTKDASFVNYSEIEGLPNNTIHAILEDDNGDLWLSTNGGVVRFDTDEENFRLYNYNNGLTVFEFSDGAYYKDEKTGTLFFGGINGLITISPDVHSAKQFVPPVLFTHLKLYENEYNIMDFIRTKNDKKYLQLNHNQNFFSIFFIALDYISGPNCRYFYNIENFNAKWIDNGYSNVVSLTNIPPGEYVLNVKCSNGDFTTDIYSLSIVILPPWYMTTWAYIIYFLLFVSVSYLLAQQVRRTYRDKREKMLEKVQQQKKEEIYESKLRFFTNITHEFSTPLTLIYGPCDRLISYEKSDSYIKKYAGMVMKNAERLNSLIQELIEFRRIETGNKNCVIEQLNITELSTSTAEDFTELADAKKIDYSIQVEQNLVWNTDRSCYVTILTNLLSNAFKYTPEEGKIKLSICTKDNSLEIIVSNTGAGIKEEEIPYIFDRYKVLENFEKQTQHGLFSRNGLGLAICHNMVKLLEGTIDVKSIPNEFTEFKTVLPVLEVTTVSENSTLPDSPEVSPQTTVNALTEVNFNEDYKLELNRTKLTIFVIEDDPEIRGFMAEFLGDKYNVILIENPLLTFEILEKTRPHLIISDIMMPEMDGISLLKKIKGDRRTSHIPFILISAKNTPEEQTEGIASGAEAYIVKPFNVEYCQSVIERLLKRQSDLKEYYRSAISAYEFADGKLIHTENKDFFEKVVTVIDKNLTNSEFTTEQLAKELGLSSRHLYRKLNEIMEQTPAALIKEYRLSVVESLLVASKLSIEEIMYKAGFNNRGSFYRTFSQKYGMTPKQYREEKNKEEILNSK